MKLLYSSFYIRDNKLSTSFITNDRSVAGNVLVDNFNWSKESKPMSKMLLAFLRSVVHNDYDKLLDNSIGLSASQVIDQIADHYYAKLKPWLNDELIKNYEEIKSDLCYALTEMLHVKNIKPNETIESRIDFIYRQLKEDILMSNYDQKNNTI